MSDALYASCAEVLSLCQSMKDDLAALLDPETGFAPRLRQICRDQLAEFDENRDERAQPEELAALRMEANTWGLLQALIPARKTDPEPLPKPRSLLASNPYTPTSTLAQSIMYASPLLSELVVVREWLHETAPQPHHSEATTGYWKFTKHGIMQAKRTGSTRDGLIKEMDPDAVNREGRTLAADDASYEKSLAQALYSYIRAGRLEDAVELCRKAHQPWRSASIRGSLLFSWRAVANEPTDDDAMEDDDLEAWLGNRRRKLWKSTCTRAALNPTLSDSDRILYAALAPSPSTSAVLKSACRTWEDHLWAQISIMCEEKQSAEMIKLGGGFWEGGVSAVEKVTRKRSAGEEDDDLEEAEWEKEAVGALETLGAVGVLEGPPADHAFHVSQLNIILGRTDPLLEVFADGLRDGHYDPASIEYPTMTRFFAHLCLYLQMIDIPVAPLATQIILEAYLQVLEAAGQRDLIALYAGALGDNAVERYAMFLASLEISADMDERRLALTRARDHGLDMERVAVATAERTIEKAFEMLPPLKGALPSIIAMQPPASDAEKLLLRSIEWTTFLEGTYDTALEQANVILRYFLGSGRIQVAQLLLRMLPLELASISEPEERATEYLHYRQFFNIWETLARIVECQALEVQVMSKDTRAAWIKDYTGLVDHVHEQITKLLTSEWLVSDVENPAGDRRRRDLIRIRQIYIPELVLRLHSLLVSARHIPHHAYLKRALELANIVADSRYRTYEDFVDQDSRRLGDYLVAVRGAILDGLEGGGSDPLRVLL